jgi:c-di-GMP-binding flagellar brake protein YcgR
LPSASVAPGDVVWRCKLIITGDDGLVVEMPSAVGRPVRITVGTELLAGFSVGQNRWMFHTRVTGYKVLSLHGHEHAALILALPEKVERCSRREHFRISTSTLNLARVQCWPLLDPTTVVAARIRELMSDAAPAASSDSPDSILLPEVGPMFEARLQNLSGGGLGLLLGQNEAAASERARHIWLRLDLRPEIPTPIAITAKRAHSHLESSGFVYCGLAFEFSFNPEHQKFVFELLSGYIDRVQQNQKRQSMRAG